MSFDRGLSQERGVEPPFLLAAVAEVVLPSGCGCSTLCRARAVDGALFFVPGR